MKMRLISASQIAYGKMQFGKKSFAQGAAAMGMSWSAYGRLLNARRHHDAKIKGEAEAEAKTNRKLIRVHKAWERQMKHLTWLCPVGRSGMCSCLRDDACPFGHKEDGHEEQN